MLSGGLLWLNLFLGNKMNHDNVTEQIGSLALDLQSTKETLLTKLEVNISLHVVLHSRMSLLGGSKVTLGTMCILMML